MPGDTPRPHSKQPQVPHGTWSEGFAPLRLINPVLQNDNRRSELLNACNQGSAPAVSWALVATNTHATGF